MKDVVLKYPTWQEPYRAAVIETNPKLLKQKIAGAEQAAILRLKQQLIFLMCNTALLYCVRHGTNINIFFVSKTVLIDAVSRVLASTQDTDRKERGRAIEVALPSSEC
jgi:hypothetical protein